MVEESGSRGHHYKKYFQIIFTLSINLCDQDVIGKYYINEEDSQGRHTNQSILFCDMDFIDEDK